MYLYVLKLHHSHAHVMNNTQVCVPSYTGLYGWRFWLEDKRNVFFLTSTPHFLLLVVTNELLLLMHVKNRNTYMTG